MVSILLALLAPVFLALFLVCMESLEVSVISGGTDAQQ